MLFFFTIFLHSKTSNTNCEMALFNRQGENIRMCIYLYYELNGSIFHKLQFKNMWIYTVDKDNVVLTCSTDEKSDTTEIIGTDLLTFDEQCKEYASQNLLHPVGCYYCIKFRTYRYHTRNSNKISGNQINNKMTLNPTSIL